MDIHSADELCAALKTQLLEELRKREVQPDWLAKQLRLLPIGLEIMMSRTWSLEEIADVAAAMKIHLRFDVTFSEEGQSR